MQSSKAESLAPLAHLAMKEAGAEGYAIYRRDPNLGFPELLEAHGIAIADALAQKFAIARFPLRVEKAEVGLLEFVFRQTHVPDEAVPVLDRLARAIESVWALTHTPQSLVGLAVEISRLQGELADLKIADRARGFLTHPQPNAAGIMAHHVETVVETRRLETLLGQFARDLKNQIEERRLVARAKTLLQTNYGISEEQAHSRLRLSSRRSRRRLGIVAEQFIKGQHDVQST